MNDTNAAKLLPCPLCNAAPTIGNRFDGMEIWTVFCSSHAPFGSLAVEAGTEAEAIAAWNTRPQPAPVEGEPDFRWFAELIVDNGEGGAQLEITDEVLRESLIINAEKQIARVYRLGIATRTTEPPK